MSESFYNSDKLNKIFSYIDLLKDNSNTGDVLSIDKDKNPYWVSDSDVGNAFTIEFGSTTETYESVANRIADGEILFCHYFSLTDDVTLPYVCTTTSGKHVFTNMVGNRRWSFYLDSSGWTANVNELATKDSVDNVSTDLATYKKNNVIAVATVTTLDALKTQLTAWHQSMADNSTASYWIITNAVFQPFRQSRYLCRLSRVTTSYAWAEFTNDIGSPSGQYYQYGNNHHIQLNFIAGTWTTPVNVAGRLENYYDLSTRPTTADYMSSLYDGSMVQFKVTSSMTENKPASDGHIIHLNWDSNVDAASQLYLSASESQNPRIRVKTFGSWKDWHSLAFDNSYGTCSTAAATAAKVATITDFTLSTNRQVTIYFSTANTAEAPTLNISGTGAKAISTGDVLSANNRLFWKAGCNITFLYDGTYYRILSISPESQVKIYAPDTRSINYLPSDYTSDVLRSKGISAEFKSQATVGFGATFSNYLQLVTHTPWDDNSGGVPVQEGFATDSTGSPILKLRGAKTDNTAWNDWYPVLFEKARPATTSITSLANLKTQLTTWWGFTPEKGIKLFYFEVSGSWSPFVSGAGVIVVIERGTTSGSASFYARTANSPVMARMSYISNAWSNFITTSSTQIVTYAGAGTSGSAHACSVTFDFAPKIIEFLGYTDSNGLWKDAGAASAVSTTYGTVSNRFPTSILTTTATANKPPYPSVLGNYPSYCYSWLSNNGRTFNWYYNSTGSSAPTYQFNESGNTYHVLGIS